MPKQSVAKVIGRLGFSLITVLAFSGVSRASDARVVSLDDRIRGAENVVVASVRAVTAEWRQNEHGDLLIVSRLLLEVDETIKGAAPRSMVMEMEGGTLDGYTLRVSSLPLIQEPGDRAVFFLDSVARGLYAPHLRGQGILFVEGNAIRGSTLRVDDVRMRARALGR